MQKTDLRDRRKYLSEYRKVHATEDHYKKVHREAQCKYYAKNKSYYGGVNGKKRVVALLKRYPWYWSFLSAKHRCENKKYKNYRTYGGRGIKFLMTHADFEFLWKRDIAELMDRTSIDRINNDGNYEVDNCRFIEMVENSR